MNFAPQLDVPAAESLGADVWVGGLLMASQRPDTLQRNRSVENLSHPLWPWWSDCSGSITHSLTASACLGWAEIGLGFRPAWTESKTFCFIFWVRLHPTAASLTSFLGRRQFVCQPFSALLKE